MQTPLGAICMADITDGASATLLVAEKRLNSASLGLSTDDNESYCTAGWNGDWEVYRWGQAQPASDFHLPGDTNPQHVFGSAHPTGFNCVFCDGSVRFLRYSVNLNTWMRACVRNDNQLYNQNDL
jgi:prepilin-type processing-associated H-X9-DG protein